VQNTRDLVIGMIRRYQILAPRWLRACCRFEPSCSQYSIDAIAKHGLNKGGLLALKRLAKCTHNNGGFDPIRD